MVPTALLEDSIPVLVASDPTLLAPAAQAVQIHLIAVPFSPSRLTDIGALTEAAFAGSSALPAGVGTQQSFRDPQTADNIVQLLEPAGGWHWQCTTAPASPETIYGYVATKFDNTTTLGSGLLPTPVIIAAVGDAIDLPEVRLSIPTGLIS